MYDVAKRRDTTTKGDTRKYSLLLVELLRIFSLRVLFLARFAGSLQVFDVKNSDYEQIWHLQVRFS